MRPAERNSASSSGKIQALRRSGLSPPGTHHRGFSKPQGAFPHAGSRDPCAKLAKTEDQDWHLRLADRRHLHRALGDLDLAESEGLRASSRLVGGILVGNRQFGRRKQDILRIDEKVGLFSSIPNPNPRQPLQPIETLPVLLGLVTFQAGGAFPSSIFGQLVPLLAVLYIRGPRTRTNRRSDPPRG